MFVRKSGLRYCAIGLFVLAGFAVQAEVCQAARYYVGNNGSDSRSRSQAEDRSTPWQNIRHAMNQVSGGDEVIVLDGTYYENVFITRSGYDGGEIILRAENKRAARIFGSISAQDQSYIRIDGFDVTNSSSTGQTKGIAFTRCHHITIRSNRVRDCWGGGIGCDQSDWILIEWNLVHENAFFNPEQHSGISIYQPQYRSSDSRTYGIIIRNNTSFGNWNWVDNPRFGRPTDGNGIVADDYFNSQSSGNGVPYNRQTIIENNLCYNNGGQGIHCFKAQNIQIRNNTCVNNMGAFDFGGEVTVSESERIYIYNNVLQARTGRRAALQFRSENFWFGFNIIDGPTQDVPFSESNHYGDPNFRFNSFVPESFSPAINSGRNAGDHYSKEIYGRNRIVDQIDRGAFEQQ